tara:strand:- start:227 stop:448 length:222 start_codon:yes stop_codon:yes gene_type:complete
MERQEKEYTFTVYRTVQQSVRVTVTSDREVDAKELGYLANEAEWQAGELPDGDWKIEEVDTMYAIYEEYAKKE